LRAGAKSASKATVEAVPLERTGLREETRAARLDASAATVDTSTESRRGSKPKPREASTSSFVEPG